MEVVIDDKVAFLPRSGAAVFFSRPSMAAFSGTGSSGTGNNGTSVPMPQIITDLVPDLAPWGEDNLFPQHIVAQLNYCGVAKEVLDWKARALYGAGLFWGKVKGYKDDGTEIFEIAKPGSNKDIEDWMRLNGNLSRYFLEFNQDWYHFANCFPEMIFTNDRKKVARLIHQESCDCRYKQAGDDGIIKSVYLSKTWSDLNDQLVAFKKKPGFKSKESLPANGPKLVDNRFVKERRAIDMYNALEDLQLAAKEKHTNVILPVNYPSPNKTYYQLAVWDGARLSGWLEIAAKIPTMLKTLYEKAFNIKYHIEIPEAYWERRFGAEAWNSMNPEERKAAKSELLRSMDEFLAGAENAHKALVSYFDIDRQTGTEYGRIKITPVDTKTNIDKEQLASSMANSEICFSNGVNPDLIGAGAPGGPYSGSAGSGSNIREAYLTYTSMLKLEREVILEPLKVIQQYNGWDPELQWRFRDVVLTTLDQGKGTEKKLS